MSSFRRLSKNSSKPQSQTEKSLYKRSYKKFPHRHIQAVSANTIVASEQDYINAYMQTNIRGSMQVHKCVIERQRVKRDVGGNKFTVGIDEPTDITIRKILCVTMCPILQPKREESYDIAVGAC